MDSPCIPIMTFFSSSSRYINLNEFLRIYEFNSPRKMQLPMINIEYSYSCNFFLTLNTIANSRDLNRTFWANFIQDSDR